MGGLEKVRAREQEAEKPPETEKHDDLCVACRIKNLTGGLLFEWGRSIACVNLMF